MNETQNVPQEPAGETQPRHTKRQLPGRGVDAEHVSGQPADGVGVGEYADAFNGGDDTERPE